MRWVIVILAAVACHATTVSRGASRDIEFCSGNIDDCSFEQMSICERCYPTGKTIELNSYIIGKNGENSVTKECACHKASKDFVETQSKIVDISIKDTVNSDDDGIRLFRKVLSVLYVATTTPLTEYAQIKDILIKVQSSVKSIPEAKIMYINEIKTVLQAAFDLNIQREDLAHILNYYLLIFNNDRYKESYRALSKLLTTLIECDEKNVNILLILQELMTTIKIAKHTKEFGIIMLLCSEIAKLNRHFSAATIENLKYSFEALKQIKEKALLKNEVHVFQYLVERLKQSKYIEEQGSLIKMYPAYINIILNSAVKKENCLKIIQAINDGVKSRKEFEVILHFLIKNINTRHILIPSLQILLAKQINNNFSSMLEIIDKKFNGQYDVKKVYIPILKTLIKIIKHTPKSRYVFNLHNILELFRGTEDLNSLHEILHTAIEKIRKGKNTEEVAKEIEIKFKIKLNIAKTISNMVEYCKTEPPAVEETEEKVTGDTPAPIIPGEMNDMMDPVNEPVPEPEVVPVVVPTSLPKTTPKPVYTTPAPPASPSGCPCENVKLTPNDVTDLGKLNGTEVAHCIFSACVGCMNGLCSVCMNPECHGCILDNCKHSEETSVIISKGKTIIKKSKKGKKHKKRKGKKRH